MGNSHLTTRQWQLQKPLAHSISPVIPPRRAICSAQSVVNPAGKGSISVPIPEELADRQHGTFVVRAVNSLPKL